MKLVIKMKCLKRKIYVGKSHHGRGGPVCHVCIGELGGYTIDAVQKFWVEGEWRQ